MRDDTTRLRVLLTTLDLPLRLEEPDTIVGANDACGAVGFFVSTHAPGFVAAVNALPGLLDRVEAAEARVAELEATIAGRMTPPTDTDVVAHGARGGAWLIQGGRWVTPSVQVFTVASSRDWYADRGVVRWWPIDRDGRLCAWPAAEVSRG